MTKISNSARSNTGYTQMTLPNAGGLLKLVQTLKKKMHSPTAQFLKEFCMKPRKIGAVWPSSHTLAKRMALCLPAGDGLIVELGAGTGKVTKALALSLNNANRLWAVEQSETLAGILAETMPNINVIHGDARELSHVLPSGHTVDAIISSLPLKAFSATDIASITDQWHSVLAPNGIVVQFTYALYCTNSLARYGFEEIAHSLVWKNIPPARVQILQKAH